MGITFNTVIFALAVSLVIFVALRISFRLGVYKAYKVFLKDATVGRLIVNTTDPDKDVFALDLDCALGELPEREYIVFKVDNKSSQEKPVV